MFELYSADIYRLAFGILKDKDTAKDVVQETFIKYIDNEKNFKGEASLKTWLLVIARNHCFSRLRKVDLKNVRIQPEIEIGVHQPGYELNITLNDALKNLTEEQREILYLKTYCGYSYKEIAVLKEISSENVAVIVFRSRQILKSIIKQRD